MAQASVLAHMGQFSLVNQSELSMTVKMKALATALSLCTAFSTLSATAAVDAALPDYERASGISGNLTSIGSGTLATRI